MLRLIVKIGTTFKTYDFDCPLLEADLKNRPELVGVEVLSPGARLLAIEDVGSNKIKAIKAVRAHTGLGLKEAKEYIESAPVELPNIDPLALARLVDDLRAAGCAVEG